MVQQKMFRCMERTRMSYQRDRENRERRRSERKMPFKHTRAMMEMSHTPPPGMVWCEKHPWKFYDPKKHRSCYLCYLEYKQQAETATERSSYGPKIRYHDR